MEENKIEIRPLTTIEDLEEMQQVEVRVWNMKPIPLHQTFTSLQNGGIILGAFAGYDMVGFLYSFPGFKNRSVHLCSHMLGIIPEYQMGGIGVKMKQKQAKLAREKGYPMITWTFDPLESRNAYLNLHKLGAIGQEYNSNYYGSMQDELNQGLPTDRIQIEWFIHEISERKNYPFDREKLLLDENERGEPVMTELAKQADLNISNVFFIAIPEFFQEIKLNDLALATKWRIETRTIIQRLFEAGFIATDLIPYPKRTQYCYVFTKTN